MKHRLGMGIALLSIAVVSIALLSIAVVSIAIVSAINVAPALAQEGDGRAGLTLAQDTCAACHAIRRGQQSTNANAPAFDKIANVPGMTAIALQASLQTSHRSMPNLILSTEDRRNVAAYILSLKAN